MGDLLQFPAKGVVHELMPGHAVDLRRVISYLRSVRDKHPTISASMWLEFERGLAERISGFLSLSLERADLGYQIIIKTSTVVGDCSFSVLVYDRVLRV